MAQIERLYELNHPIPDARLEEFQEQLKNLQGNILQAHGRAHCVCIFLRFKEGKQNAVKRWVKTCAEDITSAQNLYDEIVTHGTNRSQKGDLFRGFFLSAEGYNYLEIKLDDYVFFGSMKKSRLRLGDPVVKNWQERYQKDIHAMVLLAYGDDTVLEQEKDDLLAELKDKDMTHVDVINGKEVASGFIETGQVIRQQGRAVEHFGYADGISQPLFFERDIERLEGQTEQWHPGTGPGSVLVPDVHAGSKAYSGSYLVFRKLEQNVMRFASEEQRLAHALGLTGDDAKRAGALAIGRFKDGTPVTISGKSRGLERPLNNFRYDADPHGLKCPLHAHIRKMNSRQNDSFKTRPLIVRRGITYDDREHKPTGDTQAAALPEKDVGLLFMCYQNNIRDNFEFMQMEWANNPERPKGPERQSPGTDPVMSSATALRQRWPTQWGAGDQKKFDFQSCVTLKGGEYFFAPSIHFLKNLK